MASLAIGPAAGGAWLGRARRTWAFGASPLARRIVTFNIMAATCVLVAVVLVGPYREGTSDGMEVALETQTRLVATLFDAGEVPGSGAVRPALGEIGGGLRSSVFLFDARLRLVEAHRAAHPPSGSNVPGPLHRLRDRAVDRLATHWAMSGMTPDEVAHELALQALPGGVVAGRFIDADGRSRTAAAVTLGNGGAVVLIPPPDETGGWFRLEREEFLRMLVVAVVISIAAGVLLARSIAAPLSQLADAVETGRNRNTRAVGAGRVRIPDLTGRPDEIGRLAGALRGMLSALYDRVEANEAFAADVAHEIKNPLASLKSAVEALRVARDEARQSRLLEVIQQDVRRLDRLVSDISNASRLDSELVREDEESFDLLNMVRRLVDFLTQEASAKGVEVIPDLPEGLVVLRGLEARLAQVVVNLVCNAISFCEEGDAIRVWVRRRDRRVLLVVEDTGPGIPEEALERIFARFYSERPAEQFGNNSGLGLAISKQIVEAHGGVIWAENIRPTQADITSDPLGARFVVGLPV